MKKISMKKRIASWALVAVMLLSYFPAAVWAVDSGTDIKAIAKPTGLIIAEDYDDYFGDSWVDKLELPGFVTVTLASNSTVECPVTWDTSLLDTRTSGYYFLPGTVSLPSGATNGQNLTVSITVRVQEMENLFSNSSFEGNTNGWSARYWYAPQISSQGLTRGLRRPGAVGDYAFAVASHKNAMTSYPLIENDNTESGALAQKIQELGAGQYYISAQIRDYDEANGGNITEGTNSGPFKATVSLFRNETYVAGGTGEKQVVETPAVTISKDTYTTTGVVFELSGTDAWIRAKVNLKSSSTFSAEYVLIDDMQLIPLKLSLKAEPANIEEIKTEIPSRFIALNFDKYVGDSWKDSLGLPETVEVITAEGDTASVGVTWSFAGLDFSKAGKYTVTGTLDNSAFPNPKGLTVKQNLYVREISNLLSNPSFETGYRDGWKPGYDARTQLTPAAVGNYALGVQSNANTAVTSYRLNETSDTQSVALASKVAQLGGGVFYISAQARDYTPAGEVPHTDALSVSVSLYRNSVATASGERQVGESAAVAISDGKYVTVGGVFQLDGTDAWLRPKLMLKSDTAFAGQWILMDDVQFLPLSIPIPKGEEPADVVEILEEIPERMVALNYDKYVGADWQGSLGLPATVKVKTATGVEASVNVIWDYSPLNLKKEGKYTLVGTLDESLYPNPEDLYVTQVIHIREAKNLFTNSNFEGNWNGWNIGYNAELGLTPSAIGKNALGVQSNLNVGSSSYRMMETTNDESVNLAAKIANLGAGQYYMSAQAQDYTRSDEVPHSASLSVAVAIYHSTVADMNTEKLTGESLPVTISDKQYVTASGIFELDGKDAWVRPKLLLKSNSAFTGQWIMVDDLQLLALNVIVEKYEGAMEEVETVIPARQIIKDYPSYIGSGYTTADLMLPENVEVRSTTGEVVTISVSWDLSELNLSKTGTYRLIGKLDDIKLENPDSLVVEQVIQVVDYTNLLNNPSFEQDNKYWEPSYRMTVRTGITSPIMDGSFSVRVTIGTLPDYDYNWLQAYKYNNPSDLGELVTRTGSGRYYFGCYAQGTSSSLDVKISPRLWYQTAATGDKLLSQIAPQTSLNTSSFVKCGDFVDLPDDVLWTRLDTYFHGESSAMRSSILYLDKMELVPLNVEVPNLTDIISCETVADIFVHEGTSFEGLKLPETLEVRLKTAQKFQVSVTWNVDEYDPNQIGEQTITGTLNLSSKYKNPSKFVPTAKITVRAKGEDLRQTIYFSTSGDESNDGLSPEKPKTDVSKIATYLAQGYNVKLKRGDIWYLPTGSYSFKSLHGTEDAPLVVGAYGSGNELPIIGFIMKIQNSAWKLVDTKRNVYAANVASLGSRDNINVHRCFVNNEAYVPQNRSNYIALDAGEFCSYNGTLYIRMAEGAPTNVEVTPYGGVGSRMEIENVSHLTFENIHFKGSSAINIMIRMTAPTAHVKFTYCSFTHCFYNIFAMDTDDDDIHYKPEISHCYIDSNYSPEEGRLVVKPWAHSSTESITMRDGVDGAWIHHNYIESMSHAFVALETLNPTGEPKITGIRNCIIEDNEFNGENAAYARAFSFCTGFNRAGVAMCRDNIFRRNRCYEMSTSSHLFGENNLVYSNIFSYTHNVFDEDGNLLEGKNPQPAAIDVLTYDANNLVGCIIANNTFYNVSTSIALYDLNDTVYNNIICNNLIVNWTSDQKASYSVAGALFDNTTGLQYVMNNAVYSTTNRIDHFVVDNDSFLAADVNGSKAGYSDNLSGDPKFVNADLTDMSKDARLDFTLSSDSPFRYAGLSINSSIYASFPAWKRMKADYTDVNGVVYLAESPSIGAVSYSEKIKGEVASIDTLKDIVVRTGATYESLPLPDTVGATNDQGIDVMLLIDWSREGFSENKNGLVTLTGTLRNGPHTDLNVAGKTVSINVYLKDRLELKDIYTIVQDFTVFYNTPYEDVLKQLPQTLQVVEEFGFEEELPVTWSCDNYNPTVPEIYTFKCILPDNLITNANDRDFLVEVDIRVLHEIGRGSELLINPDFIEGSSASPWKTGWGTSFFSVTQNADCLLPGEPAVAVVTAEGRYSSVQQDVTGQMKLMGNGKYLFQVYMRAYDSSEVIESTYACLQISSPRGVDVLGTRAEVDVGMEWVRLYSVFNVTGVDDAREIMFHTSTGKTEDDAGKRFLIGGCSLIYLGSTDAEVEATLDSVDLVWNTIKGDNESQDNIMSNLTLPSTTGKNSTVKWSSSDESVITSDGKVTMGRLPKRVTLSATISYPNGVKTVKNFTLDVPRDPEFPVYTGSLEGNQTVNPGDTFQVKLSLDAKSATEFNAYRFTLIFNTSLLEYVGISDPNSTAVMENGQLEIYGIGTPRPISDTITITFRAKKAGLTEVKLVKVEMDLDPNASMDDLPMMNTADNTALIDIQEVEDEDKSAESNGNDNSVIYIVIGLVAAAVLTGGIIAVVLIKKKKQTPPTEG